MRGMMNRQPAILPAMTTPRGLGPVTAARGGVVRIW